MIESKENVLFKTHQHIIVPIVDICKWIIITSVPLSIITFFISEYSLSITLGVFLLPTIIISAYHLFFWNRWFFQITNQRLSINARNWFFSQYDISIYFKNIKDIAYSKNNILHYIFNYWTFFARSWWWIEGDFQVKHLPNIEKIYKYINYIYSLSEEDRKNINYIQQTTQKNPENENKTKEEIIESEKINLLQIPWIKEIIQLNWDDKKYIFENEEDRNHWIYETLKRDVVFCVTHDSLFREADTPIVLQEWNKVIFPAVSFHEIKQKNTISGSPGLRVHNYLMHKFSNTDWMDATILIWFDL